jgi:hypothetical protein
MLQFINVNRNFKRPISVVAGLLAVICWCLLPSGIAAQEDGISYGISFSFLEVDDAHVANCATTGRGSTIRHSVFITRYDQPKVREEVRARLAQMHESGFDGIRLILFFGPDAHSPDWFDIKESQRASDLVRAYVEDVKAAGFKEFFLVFGMQGTATPACRQKKWGDCFDAQSTADVSDFAATVRQGLGVPPILPLRVDIAPELCAPDNLPESLRDNVVSYARSMVSAYTRRFPADRTTISCMLPRFSSGVQSIDEAYSQAGRKPSFYDVHVYNRADENVDEDLRSVGNDIAGSSTPLVIGELSYGDAGNFQRVMTDVVAATKKVEAIYFWPLKNHASQCHIDVAPPYTLKAAKGMN